MRSHWQDGDRVRTVDVTPLGGGRYRVTVDETTFELEAEPMTEGGLRLVGESGPILAQVTAADARRFVRLGSLDFVIERASGGRSRASRPTHGGLESPMPGVVTKVMAAAGDAVRKGQPLLAIEAMKMEHLIRAPRDGRVRALTAKVGEMVNVGVPLAELEDE